MTIDRQILTFMPHTVTIEPHSTLNNYAESNYGSSRTAPAYVEPNRTLGMGAQVEEQSPSTTVYVADTSIGLLDKITLPDGRTPEIISIQRHTEVAGLEHTVVNFS
jgi:hypothetical protein